MQHWRERLKDDSLLGVLQSKALGVVAVLTIHRLDGHVVLERVVESLEVLDVELDVCGCAQRQ